MLLIPRFSVLLYSVGSGVKGWQWICLGSGWDHFLLSRSKFFLGTVVEFLELLGSCGEMRQGSCRQRML